MKRFSSAIVAAFGFLVVIEAFGADWPQFRYDAGRTAASTEQLPRDLHLQWVRELPTPRPAFPGEIRLRFDVSYEPIVVGKTMFVPSMVTDSVTALETETGSERWRFFAEGPIRFAPVGWQGNVYFVSDDGYLYCVDGESGKLRWKFRGMPGDKKNRKLLGNERLISLWPARGGPALADGVVYFAAGLWPTYGVFIHALDAESGQVIWSNTDSNRIPKANQDHGIANFAGLTPQGYLAVVGDKLVVPCGAQLPAFLDLKTGELDTYCMGWGGRVGLPKGSWFAAGVGNLLGHSGDLYDISQQNEERFRDNRGRYDFKSELYPGRLLRLRIDPRNQRALGAFREPVFTPEAMYTELGGIVAYDLQKGDLVDRSKLDIPPYRREDKYPDRLEMAFREMWKMPSKLKVHIKAGQHLYTAGPGVVETVAIPKQDNTPEVVWRSNIQGTPHRMLAADGKLFVVTREGRIYAFGGQKGAAIAEHRPPQLTPSPADQWPQKATQILQSTKTNDGYALVLGIQTGRLVEELVRQSELFVIAIDADPGKVADLRDRLHRVGLYGTRTSAHVGDPLSYPLPPYLANLVVSEDLSAIGPSVNRELASRVFHPLRPYGGTACLEIPADGRGRLRKELADSPFAGLTVWEEADLVMLSRDGPLPGAADWSHRDADAGNTFAPDDQFLRAPLDLLWFDGGMRWPRNQPLVQVRVCGGRVLIKAQKLHAIDVYTGRLLWETASPISHSPGDQIVAAEDGIYVTGGGNCLVLDPTTGRRSGQINAPGQLTGAWANLRIDGDQLVAQRGKTLFCLDRCSGETLWMHECGRASLSVAVGGGRVFCAELPDKRLGAKDTKTRAFDLRTGKLVWEIAGGARLRYSPAQDALLTPGAIRRGKDGSLVVTTERFDQKHGDHRCSPLAIAGSNVLWGTATSFATYDITSGDPVGERMMWVRRGCTGMRASTNLVTTRFRANSSYIDLATRAITPIWNIRPGCNNNLYPANGVLNIPNITGGCECNYTPNSQAYVPTSVIERTR